jgi:hypothetical protein
MDRHTVFNAIDGRKVAKLQPFLLKNIFTNFKRHDLGSNFWERNRWREPLRLCAWQWQARG